MNNYKNIVDKFNNISDSELMNYEGIDETIKTVF